MQAIFIFYWWSKTIHYSQVFIFYSTMTITQRIMRVVSTIIAIGVNALAVTLPLNGVTTETLSDNLSTLITPAGFTFGIWSVIYLGLIVVAGMVARWQISTSPKILWAYVISCLLNASWIVAWHYGYLTAAMLIIVWLLVSLIVIDRHIVQNEVEHFPSWFRSVFLVYFGWVQIATLVMTTVYLIYYLEWITPTTLWWPVAALILAVISNSYVVYRTWRIETSLVLLRALWWLYAAQSDPTIQTTVLITGWLMLVVLAYHFSRRTKSTPIPSE